MSVCKCLVKYCLVVSLVEIYDVIFHEDDDEHDEHSSASVEFTLVFEPGRGAQIRTVASSDAEANIDGYTGFHETQFTVLVWPDNFASGSSRFMCQMYTLKYECRIGIEITHRFNWNHN